MHAASMLSLPKWAEALVQLPFGTSKTSSYGLPRIKVLP